MTITDNVSAALLAAGFEPKELGPEDVHVSKAMKAWDMPYMRENAIDGVNIFESTEVVVQVTSEGKVSLIIADYPGASEGPFSIGSDEGLAILRDAGLNLAS